MNEYNDLLKKYLNKHYYIFSSSDSESKEEWGNVEMATHYLEKYWLPQEEYETQWKPLQDAIFINQDTTLPAMLFKDGYYFIAYGGGNLFLQQEFEALQKCMLAMNEEYFVIIQNTHGKTHEFAPFRMKFPTNITWEELNSGNYISSILLNYGLYEFFVFGITTRWGMYSANESIHLLCMIAFKPEYANIFAQYIIVLDEFAAAIDQLIPAIYDEKILWIKQSPHVPEYTKILNAYFAYPLLPSMIKASNNMHNQTLAREYLDLYWLPFKEYTTVWEPTQNSIFINQTSGLPQLKFADSYAITILNGDKLFTQQEFEALQHCMLALDSTYFVIIQNTCNEEKTITSLKMKYPSTISWEEFNGDNRIANYMLNTRYGDFFVFDSTAQWGKYAAHYHRGALNIIGFKPKHTALFQHYLPTPTEQEWNIIESRIPKNYKELSNFIPAYTNTTDLKD